MHKIDNNDLQYAKERADVIGWVPDVRGEDGKINPHMTRFVTADNMFMDVFHVKPIYYETIGGEWRPMGEICEHHGNRKIVLNENWRLAHPRFIDWLSKRQKLFGGELLLPTPFGEILSSYQNIARPVISTGMTVTTVYPDPDPETTSCDGAVSYKDSSAWTTKQPASAGLIANDTATIIGEGFGMGVFNVSGNNWIERGHAGFDTSAIGSDTIDSVVFSGYSDGTADVYTVTGFEYARIAKSTPASNTAVVVGDYDQYGNVGNPATGEYSSIIISSLNTTGYSDFTFNGTGEADINGSGVTNLSLRCGDDRTTEPAGWSNNDRNRFIFLSAEQTGTTTDPKMVITHTASAALNTNFLAVW